MTYMSVCLSVCLSASISREPMTRPNFTKFSVHVACSRGSVLLVVIRYVLPVLLITSAVVCQLRHLK